MHMHMCVFVCACELKVNLNKLENDLDKSMKQRKILIKRGKSQIGTDKKCPAMLQGSLSIKEQINDFAQLAELWSSLARLI